MGFRMVKIFLTSGDPKGQGSRSNPKKLKSNITKTVRDREQVPIEVR